MAKAIFNEKKTFHQQIEVKFRKKLLNWYMWSKILCGAENWTLRKVDQKYLEVLKCGAVEGWRSSFGPIV